MRLKYAIWCAKLIRAFQYYVWGVVTHHKMLQFSIPWKNRYRG